MTAVMEDTDVLYALDFDAPVRCGHEYHDTEPDRHADGNELLVRYLCPNCGPSPVAVRCAPWVIAVNAGTVWIRCRECEHASHEGRYTVLGPANTPGGTPRE